MFGVGWGLGLVEGICPALKQDFIGVNIEESVSATYTGSGTAIPPHKALVYAGSAWLWKSRIMP